MRILAYNPGHDGAVALIEQDRLTFSLEAEKDDGLRHDAITPTVFVRSMQLNEPPDIIALSGLYKRWIGREQAADAETAALARVEAGYFEEQGKTDGRTLFCGKYIRRFASSHVRCHIMCAHGMSQFGQDQPCYVLIWEGTIGAMYYVDEDVSICKIGDVLHDPGNRYSFLYGLADPTVPNSSHGMRDEYAGKLMALAAYGQRREVTSEERDLIQSIFSADIMNSLCLTGPPLKETFSSSRYCNIGLESQEFKDLAWQFQEALFDRFFQFASKHVTPGLPLLIAGGCGLNCDWNTQWQQCGLFSDVFVPPCPNDSGIAIGAAIDALHHYTGRTKIDWNVYAGDPFVEDALTPHDFECHSLNRTEVCRCLLRGDVIAWVQGKWEIGPRALGNRSLLAAPFAAETREKLNRIKQRERYRPIAPICLEEDFDLHFAGHGRSPHMLYFQRVKSITLNAITHADGSARAQSVSDQENPEICALLREFREISGVAVLCNTSLNFKGFGFVNRLSQLFVLARNHGIDGLVVGDRYWKVRHAIVPTS